MGAVKNNHVFKGVAINGQVVKGLAKNGVVFWKAETFHPLTTRIFARASAIGATLPTDQQKFDSYIRSMADIITSNFDVFFRFRGTGDVNFKRINLANPEGALADFYGGYTLDISGFKGNGVNAYINTNYNPSLLVSGQKYQLNDASAFVNIVENSSSGSSSSIFPLLGYTLPGTFFISICTSTSGYQRINNSLAFNRTLNFNNLGLKGYSRNGNSVLQINKNEQSSLSSNSASLPSTITLLGHNSISTYNNDVKLSSMFLGKSISFEVSQQIRVAENVDMANLGLPQIA